MVVLAIAAAFAGTAGWLSPGRLDPARMIDRFEAVNGAHPGFRRNHAKGVCLTGWFDSNGAGARLSTAAVFAPGRMPVIGRFALAGGLPMMPDGPNAVRSLALEFRLAGRPAVAHRHERHPGVSAEGPAAPSTSSSPRRQPDPKTGKPDPAAVQAFFAAHPESARALALIKAQPFSSGFANATYNSLNAFRLRRRRGHGATGTLVDGARRCLRAGACRYADRQELPVRCPGRAGEERAGAVASGADRRPAGRSDQRRHACRGPPTASRSMPACSR